MRWDMGADVVVVVKCPASVIAGISTPSQRATLSKAKEVNMEPH